MLDKRNQVGLWLFVLILMTAFLQAGESRAATYDATGRWSVVYTPNPPVTPLATGCLPVRPDAFVVTIAQTDDAFTLSEPGNVQASGTISGESYAWQITRPDASSSTLSMTLSQANTGSGTVTTSRSDGQGGTCITLGTVAFTRAVDAVFDISGAWNLQVDGDVLDSAVSAQGCQLSPAKTLQGDFVQSGNTFVLSLPADEHLTGDIDGGIHSFKSSSTGNATQFVSTRFLLINADSGNGTMQWVRNSGGMVCAGANSFTLTRTGTTSNPDDALSVAAMNLTVGQSRLLELAHVTGTPTVTVAPESGVASVTMAGGVYRLACDATGQAVVTVTDAKGAATATMNCVAGVTGGSGTFTMAEWLYPEGVTLVSRNQWQSKNAGDAASDGFRWSRAGGKVAFLDRGNLSVLAGDDGMIYSLDDKGLIFHGEKRFDVWNETLTYKAYYGFVNPPDLTMGAAGILPENLAVSNLTPPPALLPASVNDGDSATLVRIEFDLDAAGQPMPGQWNVVQQVVTVAGPVDLLAADPPEELRANGAFLAWRDAITQSGLLNKLTGVLRVHLVETRFKAGESLPVTESGDLYLVRGVGIVFEQWHEKDGESKSALLAMEAGNGLVSLTDLGIVARKFRVDAPSGTTLENVFVQARVEHTQGAFAAEPHTHESVARYSEPPTGNSALLTLYDQANADDGDSTHMVRLNHGAKGFETQVSLNVDLTTLANPAILALTADQSGHAVSFPVKDLAGVVQSGASVQIAPYVDGVCDVARATSRELSAAGVATFTLANGQRCVAVWPKSAGAFIGGWYDPSRLAGLVNIVKPTGTAQGMPATIAAATTILPLVVSHDNGPNNRRISGTLTDGTTALVNADILAYPADGGNPYLFHTDATGAFSFDLPEGAYVFAFR
ncbi:MAG: hypothetical protein HQL95_04250, partial [Magnetococcales bacterium]|nr:hypothetical protein [Magnetococcales bacterium]